MIDQKMISAGYVKANVTISLVHITVLHVEYIGTQKEKSNLNSSSTVACRVKDLHSHRHQPTSTSGAVETQRY